MHAPAPHRGDASPESAQTRLLALAEEEIRRAGFRRLRVVAVAEAAGMSHANIYRYFPSRLALADAVTVGWLKPIEAMLLDAATAPDPAADKIGRMLLALARAYRDRLERDPHLFALFADAAEKDRPVVRRHFGRRRELFGRAVEETAGEGPAARRDGEEAALMLLDLAHRFIHPTCLTQDRAMPRAAFDRRLGLALAAIAPALRRLGEED